VKITKYDIDAWAESLGRYNPDRFLSFIQNDFVPWAEGPDANVMALATYQTSPQQTNGVQSGQASSALYNRATRQAAHVAAAIGAFMLANGQSALDDGNQSEFVTSFEAALVAYLESSTVIRIPLTSNLNVYVNASSGNDSNAGTVGAPWQTLQHAWNILQSNYDLRGFQVVINATGAFTAGVQTIAPVSGTSSASSVVWQFTAGATVNVTSSICFNTQNGAQFTIQGNVGSPVVLSASGSGAGVGYAVAAAFPGTTIVVGAGVNFGTCGNVHIQAIYTGLVALNANYTISGGAQYHVTSTASGVVVCLLQPMTITLTGTPNFSQAFASCSESATYSVFSGAVTFSGSATGTRYLISANAVINTNGGGASYLPGNVGGTAATGGQYI
jgi:hypothetical protein